MMMMVDDGYLISSDSIIYMYILLVLSAGFLVMINDSGPKMIRIRYNSDNQHISETAQVAFVEQ